LENDTASTLRVAMGCCRHDDGSGAKDSGSVANFLAQTESFAGRETSDSQAQ
jgi:hypothetical protein